MALARSRFGVLLLALSVLLVTVGLPSVATASEAAAGDVGVAAAPGRVLVTWEAWATEADRALVRQHHGLVVRDAIDALDFEVLRIPGGVPAEVTSRLNGEAAIKIAEPDYVLEAESNDPGYGNLWGLNQTNDVDIDAPEAWTITRGSSSVIVAVIDTGVQITHPDLAANIWTNPGETAGNGIDDDGNGYVDDVNGWDWYYDNASVFDSASEDDHGTHVAGTIAAVADNSVGVAGVAPNVKIMPLKFLGGSSSSGFTSDAVLAVNYAAAKGAKVINASWGGGGFNSTLKSAIESAGAIFVAAAGNASNDNDASPFYPASYDSANVLSVASVTSTGALSSFSNYGAASVDVGAPGSSIYSTYPTDTYAYLSGTSMAAPHAAGVAALVASLDSSLTGSQLVSAVKTGAQSLSSLSGKTVTGGLVNAMESVRPYGAPGAPTGIAAVAGHEKATVSWTAPTTGAAAASYAVTVSPTTGVTGDVTRSVTAPTASFAFTGLANGTAYSFTVTATNTHGTSPASTASNAVTPNPTVPDAPTNVAVTPGVAELGVSWTAPSANGSTLTGYTVTATPEEGDATTVNVTPDGQGNLATTATLTGLTNATAYAVTVTATNSIGTSVASTSVSGTLRTVPDAPSGVATTGANAKATVTWTAPAFNGGSAITGYTVTATPAGGSAVTASVSASGDGSAPTSAVVTGLTNGTTYAVTVAATNAAGTGAVSAATTVVPTETVPGPPTIVSATAGDGQASVTWSAPADDGGTPITAYTLTASPGGATATTDGSTTSATVTGLTNGTAYAFTVAATNALGTGSASPASSSVTPAAPAPPPSSGGGFSGGGGGGGGAAPAPAPTAPATGTASGEVTPGGTITTDPTGTGATPTSPVQTKITSPVAGTVDVAAGTPTAAAPSGWLLIDHEVTITAPAATPEEPLEFEFHLDGSIDAAGVTVFRNGAEVGECLGASVADPDPCVTARSASGDDTVLTVLTSRASRWNFGFVASACPDVRVAASSFTDLGGSAHARSVECLAWWGAASGVSTTAFAPTNTVTRAQMASFVARTLESAGIDLPAGTDRFTDDEGTPHEASINALAAAGIVSGVGADRYDPGGSVTRAQMATFLIRAARHATGEAFIATADEFRDDDGSPHEPSINAARAFGLASGTGPTTFNPDGYVSREQMATFLVNLLDLLVDRGLARPPAD